MSGDRPEAPLFGLDSRAGVPALERAQLRRTRALPRAPSRRGRPRRQHGPDPSSSDDGSPQLDDDPELWRVHEELTRLDPLGVRIAYAIRQAFDQVYDGQRTGRWDYSQLMKTEKTHIGTLVEIWLQREFGFSDGDELDFKIAGAEVDAKWSRNLYDWEIPAEMYTRGPRIALLLWANEDTVRMAAGILRVDESVLRPVGRQRDGKRRLNPHGVDRIRWLHTRDLAFPNTLLGLDPDLALRIAHSRSGQSAVNLMFRESQGALIDRVAVTTAGQQVDPAKRVRDARAALVPEGIVIFGHYDPHPDLAVGLGLPRPTLGHFVSARLASWSPGDPERPVEIGGSLWRIARVDEPTQRAPTLPSQGRDNL